MHLVQNPALPRLSFTRLKTITVVIGLIAGVLLLQGCEKLGLEDEKKRRPPPPEPVPQPPLLVVTPQANFPIINRLFFEAIRLPNDPASLKQTYSLDVRRLSVLRQSAGQPAEAFTPVIPLGNERFTQSYVIIEENNRFFLGDPTTTELKQLTSFREPACDIDGASKPWRLLTDGLGFANSTVIVRYGTAEACAADMAAYVRLPLTAGPLNLPEAATELEFLGKPLTALDGRILGYFFKRPGDATLELRDTAGTVIRSYAVDPALDIDSVVGRGIAYGEDLLLSFAGALYRLPPAAYLDPAVEAVELVTLTTPALGPRTQLLRGTNLFFLDDNLLKVARLADQQVDVVADLSSYGGLRNTLQASRSFLWTVTQSGALLRIDPETSDVTSIMTGLADRHTFLAGTDVVFASLASPPTAVVLAETALSAPLCQPSEPGCYDNAHWLFFDHYREDGLTKLPMLFQGFATVTETLVNGQTVITNKPAFEETAEGRFYNASQVTQFDLASGQAIIKFASGLQGQAQIQAISVLEQDFGLIQYIGQPEDPASLSELAKINIGSQNGLTSVGTTQSLAERLLSLSQE